MHHSMNCAKRRTVFLWRFFTFAVLACAGCSSAGPAPFIHDGADAGSCIARLDHYMPGAVDDAPYCLVQEAGTDGFTVPVKVYTTPGQEPATGAGCALYGGTDDGRRTWCCDSVPAGCEVVQP